MFVCFLLPVPKSKQTNKTAHTTLIATNAGIYTQHQTPRLAQRSVFLGAERTYHLNLSL